MKEQRRRKVGVEDNAERTFILGLEEDELHSS